MIVSNFGGLSENIESGQDGWIIPVGDEVALAKLLTDIHMMDPLALTKMKQHARAKAQLEFGVENMILETQRVYDAVMSNEAINSNQ
ncbi:glycosyltransferase [Budvicia aquatica]|uniref:glycosyltransferase n=1 Tax=Budvicia aquatica TaxID=82979 RepID=UPI00141B16B3|nr:glycosyltransferase [Budvicia aquatica]